MCSCQILIQVGASAAHPYNLLAWAAHTALHQIVFNQWRTQGGREGQLTYNRLARLVVGKERAFTISDKERKIKQVFHGLPKVVWVDNEFEDIHVSIDLGQELLELQGQCQGINHSRRPAGGQRNIP